MGNSSREVLAAAKNTEIRGDLIAYDRFATFKISGG